MYATEISQNYDLQLALSTVSTSRAEWVIVLNASVSVCIHYILAHYVINYLWVQCLCVC